jgi:hypothetical protein
MDGGGRPIKDGDLLLFERLPSGHPVKSDHAANINEQSQAYLSVSEGSTVVVENRSGMGSEFLVRDLKLDPKGELSLVAQNSSYPDIRLTPEIAIVATLTSIVDPLELQLHQAFMRADIPPLFGLQFSKSIWETGHVCPKGLSDQILLVTLNKQGKNQSEQYHDYFTDEETFHWQSQNSTGPAGKRGKGIVGHRDQDSDVHLFVRKNKLENGKAGPFIYCGRLDYQSHQSEKPMNVTWKLQCPLSREIFSYFTG